MEKDHKLVCVGKYPICIKCPPFVTFVLYPTKQVNYKVSSTAKNNALLLSPNNPTKAGKFILQSFALKHFRHSESEWVQFSVQLSFSSKAAHVFFFAILNGLLSFIIENL